MGFRKKLIFQLVHRGKLSNAGARIALSQGKVKVNKEVCTRNVMINETDEIIYNGQVLKEKVEYVWYRFYKPRGYESTLNQKIEKNIGGFFIGIKGLAICGRLDKESEGLLVLTNHGKWIKNITSPLSGKEKEYEVELDKEVNEEFAENLRKGVDIGGYTTLPCGCEILGRRKIRVVLKEGKYRQIRRMCSSLNYNILSLKRIKIDTFLLEDLKPGEHRLTKI